MNMLKRCAYDLAPVRELLKETRLKFSLSQTTPKELAQGETYKSA